VRISYEEHTVTSRIDFAGAVLSIPTDSTWSELTTHRVPLFLAARSARSDRVFEGPEVIWKRRWFVPAPLHPTGRTMFDQSAKALTWSRIPSQGMSTEG
jgi:hypothetical protein